MKKMWKFMRNSIGILAAVWVLVTVLGAQEKLDTPVLTEVQQLKLQNFALTDTAIQSQTSALQAQLALLQQAKERNLTEREAYIQGVEKAHPGWLMNRQTMQWEKAPAPSVTKK